MNSLSTRSMAPLLIALSCLSVSELACSKETEATKLEEPVSARPIGHAECAACGMVVSEQPAPRVQVVHRDGERVYFCSISDSLHYLADRNSHGGVGAVFVELQSVDLDPMRLDTDEKDWAPATEAAFVTGIERPGIMGKPVLVFRTEEEAQAVTSRIGGEVQRWEDVQKILR